MKKLWWKLWKRPRYDPSLWTILPGTGAATCGVVSAAFLYTAAPLTIGSYIAGTLVLFTAAVVYQQVMREAIWWYGLRTGKVRPRPATPHEQHRQVGLTENEYTVELLDHRFGGHWSTDTTGPKVFYPHQQAAHEWAAMLSKVYGAENVRVRTAQIHFEEVTPQEAPAND